MLYTRRILVAAALPMLVLAVACGRTATSASVNDDFDQFGDRSKSMHAEARVLTRKGEVQYEDAKTLLAQGKFRSGISDLERLIADRSIDPEIREQAMLSAAEAHGSWLNPFRDFDKAVYWCQQLLAEYPESTNREHVEKLIEQYRDSAKQG